MKKNKKCPECKSRETKTINIITDEYGAVEWEIVCAKCGNLKENFFYGHKDVENFKGPKVERRKRKDVIFKDDGSLPF